MRNGQIGGFVLFLCTALLGAAPARGVTIVGTSANFTWTTASGAVAGYAVFVNRNGAGYPATPDQLVTSAGTTVSGSYGDTIVIKVAAYDASNTLGPFSPDSSLYQFAAPVTLTLSTTTLTGAAVQGGSPANTSFLIQTTGGGSLSYALSTGAAWLSVSPTSGTASATSSPIAVTMNPAGLAAATYTSTITANALGTTSSPATIGVVFTVSSAPSVSTTSTSTTSTASTTTTRHGHKSK